MLGRLTLGRLTLDRPTLGALIAASSLVVGGCNSEMVRDEPIATDVALAHDLLIEPGPPPPDLAAPSDIALLERIRQRAAARVGNASLRLDSGQPAYSDLWERLRAGMRLDPANHKRVQREIEWYSKRPQYLQRVTDRARLYLAHIVAEAEARDLPTELALLPIVESAFQPYARSPAGAAGIWQFIPSTGRRFGLKRSQWYDGRRDILDSTRAAFDYLSYLHRTLDGDWLLAMAGYNAGEGNVLRAVKRNRAKDKPQDFFSLDLPAETEAYVPRLLAIAALVAEPQRYGLALDPIELTPYFQVVSTPDQVDLGKAARMAGISLNELMLLNAGFMRHATDPEGPHRLLLPSEAVDGFREALEAEPGKLTPTLARHEVRDGDTLSSIARSYGVTVAELSATNDLDGRTLRTGQTIDVPPGLDSVAMASLSAEVREGMRRARGDETRKVYRVRSGDSLWLIARRHDTTVAKLKRWNRLGRRNHLRPGQRLVVWTRPSKKRAPTTSPAPIVPGATVHVVAPGDSLWTIARRYQVSTDSLLELNKLRRKALLKPGQRIMVRLPTSAARSRVERTS